MKLLSTIITLSSLLYTSSKEIESPPRIVKQSSSSGIFVRRNNSFIIDCVAVGEPPPKYRWYKNGKPFNWHIYNNRITQLPGRGTLIFANFENNDDGYYQCSAKNKLGTTISNSVFIQEAKLESFKGEPPLIVVGKEGQPFKLNCQTPNGTPQPIIYWVKEFKGGKLKPINNTRTSIDPKGTLWFSSLTKEDAVSNFTYTCAVYSPLLGHKFGNRIRLKVIASGKSLPKKQEPVLQYVSGSKIEIIQGIKAELFCIFGGTPMPEIAWLMNGKLIEYSDRIIKVNYGRTLKIKTVNISDDGVYTCTVSNGFREKKLHTIDLKVLVPPYFTEEPECITAGINETVEFHCRAFGIPKPEVKWIYNGKPIEEAPPNDRLKVDVNSIIIQNLTKADIGNYGCNASNSVRYIYKDVYVNVLALAPELIELPTNKEAVTNQNITLSCNVFGIPQPNVKWLHKSKESFGNNLHLKNITHNDAGQYTCYAKNAYGELSTNIKITVKDRTKVIITPKDYKAKVNSSVIFHCNVVSDSSLTLAITWLKDGQEIENKNKTLFVKSSNFSLTINKLKLNNSGVYTCVTKTRLDKAVASTTLTVQDVPNSPLIKSVQCLGHTVTIQWISTSSNNSRPITNYKIEFTRDLNLSLWELVVDKIPSCSFSFTFPVNTSGIYSFRVTAWNNIGFSTSPSHTCTITLSVPYKNPDIIYAEGTQPNNLVIKWTTVQPAEHNGPGFFYTIYWKQDISGQSYNSKTITDWQQNEFIINDLPLYQRFCIKITSSNAIGPSNATTVEIIGYSREDIPEEAPTNFTLVNILSSTTALLSWNPVSPSSVKGYFKGYKIIIWTENKSDTQKIIIEAQSTQAVVEHFSPFTKNYAQICVFNNKYDGPLSEILSFDMPEGVPEVIISLVAQQLGSTALYLKWEKPKQAKGILIGYDIKYARLYSSTTENFILRNPTITDANQVQAKLAGLKPNTTYKISIIAKTKTGESEPYYIEQTTRNIETSTPSVPSFQWQILNYDKSKNKFLVKVTWLPNFNGNPGSHFYVLFKKKMQIKFIKTPPEYNEDYIVIQGLADKEIYEFALVAVDGNFETKSKTKEIYFNASS